MPLEGSGTDELGGELLTVGASVDRSEGVGDEVSAEPYPPAVGVEVAEGICGG